MCEESCSFCGHWSHFGKCDDCDCPREHIPPAKWVEWLNQRDKTINQVGVICDNL